MRKNLTTKSILFLIIFGTIFSPLSTRAFTHTSAVHEDIVIDDLVMFEGRSSSTSSNISSNPCSYGVPKSKKSGDLINVLIDNGTLWAANFSINSSDLNVQLSYDTQTDVLSFRKTLGSGMSYIIAQDNSSITFYLNRRAALIIDNIQNCGVNACVTVRFLINKTTISLADCTNIQYSASAQSNQNTLLRANDQHKTSIALEAAESVHTANFNKTSHTISTHQVAPNPTNSTTTITYVLTADAPVRVSIYNAIGQQIAVLVNENQNKGEQNIEWKTAEILRGVYFYEIFANNERMIGKVIKQ